MAPAFLRKRSKHFAKDKDKEKDEERSREIDKKFRDDKKKQDRDIKVLLLDSSPKAYA
jgi:hypothetical protein